MVTVSQTIKKIVGSMPTVEEALMEGVVSYAALAEKLHPRVERMLGVEVQSSAMVMALRRHAEQLKSRTPAPRQFRLGSEIVMKTNLCDITLAKTPSALARLADLHKLVDYSRGEMLNVIQGNYEITIVISQKYMANVKSIMKKERVLNIEKDLVSVMLSLSRDFLYTPGMLALVTRKLAWENINVFENISTMTELIFIIAEKDAMRAYDAFQELLKESK